MNATSATQDPVGMRLGTRIALALLAVPVGAFLAWLALLASLQVRSDSPLVWFGLPLVALAAVGLIARRLRWLAIALMVGGVATLVFFAWLFTTLPGPDF